MKEDLLLLRKIIVGAESLKQIYSSTEPKQAYSARRTRILSEVSEAFGPNHPFTIAFLAVDKTGVLDSIDSQNDAWEQVREFTEEDIALLRSLMSPA